MNIENSLFQVGSISLNPSLTEQAVKSTPASGNSFDDFLQAAKDVLEETNMYELQALQAQTDYITGRDDNILNVLLSQSRASTSLTFTVQVTNKIIEAYREIMRMQI